MLKLNDNLMREIDNIFLGLENKNNFSDITNYVKNDDKNKLDIREYANNIYVTEDFKIKRRNKMNKEGIGISGYAMTQLLNRYGLPVRETKQYMLEFPKEVSDIINSELEADNREILLRARLGGNPYVRAVLSDEYTIFNNRDVLNTITHELSSQNVDIKNFYLDDKRFYLRVVFNDMSKYLQRDDVIKIGVDIRNSEVGFSSLVVEPMIYRLICLNGLKTWSAVDYEKVRHIGNNKDDLNDIVLKGLNKSIEQSEEFVNTFENSKTIKINEPVEVIYKLSAKANISNKVTEEIINNFYEEPDKSLFGIINAVTRSARNKREKRFDVEMLAGRILYDKELQQEIIY